MTQTNTLPAVQRILHIVGRMDRAGAETMLMNLYREVDKTRIQFDFAYFTDDSCDYDDEIQGLGGRIVHIRGSNLVTRFLWLWLIIRRGEWKIVHAHTLFSSGMYLLAAKFAGSPRRVVHAHSTSDAKGRSMVGRLYHSIMRNLLSWVPTDFVACGKAAAEFLFPGRQDVTILSNAIDINRFLTASKVSCNQASEPPESSLVILQIGRFMPVKNHDFSLKIAAALKSARVDFQMLFVGTGPQRSRIASSVNQYGLDEHIQMLGVRDDIPELMASADVILMPSLYEGFPVVLVEAQAAGLIAVISQSISSEVDLGLGLVRFVDLDASPESWAEVILAAKRESLVSMNERLRALEDHGFSARDAANRLSVIYSVRQ